VRVLTRATTVALLVAGLGLAAAHAQPPAAADLPRGALTIALDRPLPLDPRVVTGRLDNGIRYYIRENGEPANRAELRLVVDAGSVLEDDDQLGLAHFLEHMAFNGTEHFAKQELVEFMESIGMRLGPGVNASTSFDETIFELTLPTDDSENIATAFQILEDWATALTLDPDEIEAERGVVIEEWRLGQGAQSRVRDEQFPILLKDSRYAERLPIGTLASLESFDHAALRRFYEDWYRPDLMAVVAVGDFDAAEIERLVDEYFADIPAAVDPRERVRYDVPAHAETLFAITTDPELPFTQVGVYHKMAANDDWTAGGYRQRIVERLYDAMLSARLQEITREPAAPFLRAGSGQAELVRPESAYVLNALVPENGVEEALQRLLVEAERVGRFGFTEAELARQKTDVMRQMEQGYRNRESRSSGSFASEYTRADLVGEAAPGIEYEYALYTRFVPGITLDEVNRVGASWLGDANRVVSVTAPRKADLAVPTAADLRGVMAAVADMEITPYEDETSDAPLLAEVPEGSEVVAERTRNDGIIEWDLGNGVEVVLKPTDFREDQILFYGFSPGGTSLASDEDFVAADTAVSVIANGGLDGFDANALERVLTGKVANVAPFISEYEQGLRGGGSPADLETLMQLIYLRMTAPRADPSYFEVFRAQSRAVLENRAANPQTAFADAFNRLLFQNHPRRQPPSLAMIASTDLAKSEAFYADRFADASDFTFIFVGSIDVDAMRPLVETYLGGLPATGRDETWRDVGIRYPTGVIEETVRRGLEPQSQTRIAFTGPFDFASITSRTRLSAAADLLQARLIDVMREQLGGTYSVRVDRQPSWQPVPAYAAVISFGSDAGRADELTATLMREIESLQETGPTESELADTKQAMLRTFETGIERNDYWLQQLSVEYRAGLEPGAAFAEYPESVHSLTVTDLRDAFRQYFDSENYVRVTLVPER